MIGMIAAILLSPNPVIAGREPHAASPWIHSVRANCGNTVVSVEGYGGGRPLDAVARIAISGEALRGDAVRQLRADLSHKRAVYRLQILCGERNGITVRISEGEKQAEGPVLYRSGAAFISGNRLVSYTGLQEASADDFWFR